MREANAAQISWTSSGLAAHRRRGCWLWLPRRAPRASQCGIRLPTDSRRACAELAPRSRGGGWRESGVALAGGTRRSAPLARSGTELASRFRTTTGHRHRGRCRSAADPGLANRSIQIIPASSAPASRCRSSSRAVGLQAGHGATVGIAAPATSITPAEEDEASLLDAGAAWVHWRDRLGAHGIVDGPAWRGIDRYGRRPRAGGLHRNTVAEIIKRRAAAAGLDDAGRWGGHSLRRGFATEAIAAGVPERDVQRHGRWRSRASMARQRRPFLRRGPACRRGVARPRRGAGAEPGVPFLDQPMAAVMLGRWGLRADRPTMAVVDEVKKLVPVREADLRCGGVALGFRAFSCHGRGRR